MRAEPTKTRRSYAKHAESNDVIRRAYESGAVRTKTPADRAAQIETLISQLTSMGVRVIATTERGGPDHTMTVDLKNARISVA